MMGTRSFCISRQKLAQQLTFFIRLPIDGVTVDNAKIIGGDLTETEGVIHVIDAVIPNKPETLSVCTATVKKY
jgi:uncharacterized surface protein with fasciclin (FAS1) repeats